MRRFAFAALCLCVFVLNLFVLAQNDDLIPLNMNIVEQPNAFGEIEQVLVGDVTNQGGAAYTSITLIGDLYDEDDNVIGEAFGYLTDACGVALVDTPLLPGQTRRFTATLDIYESDVDIERYEVTASGAASDAATPAAPQTLPAVTEISTQEVVLVEWEDADTLRYGVGCAERVFTSYSWYRYELATGDSTPIEHPALEFITDDFIDRSQINLVTQSRGEDFDETLFERSFLTFTTDLQRAIFQTDLHDLISVQSDGQFKRTISDGLYQYSLQGFIWTPDQNFLAYYFGAYGEPVRYITGSARGTRTSGAVTTNTLSQIVPGVVNDARRVIIGGTFPDADGTERTGYFIKGVLAATAELLYEVDELPGNNYPAPAYYLKDNNTRYVYIVRPDGEANVLDCYHLEELVQHPLTELPLTLANTARAWTWLAPDGKSLALAANGVNGGLWVVDLAAFGVCQ